MSYKPSADESAKVEFGQPFRLRREAVVRFLADRDLKGLSTEDARRTVEAAGFEFRVLDLDRPGPLVMTADWAAERVTVTVKAGHVIGAEPG